MKWTSHPVRMQPAALALPRQHVFLHVCPLPVSRGGKADVTEGGAGGGEGLFWFYLVRATSSLWSRVTDDLLSTEGVKVTKASVLLVGEQEKSEPVGLVGRPLD